MLGRSLRYYVAGGLQRGIAGLVERLVLPVPAVAALRWGITYGGRRVRGTAGQPGERGGGGPLRHGGGGGEACTSAVAVAEVPFALANKRPLVALHPLQLLLGGHPASRLADRGLRGLGGEGQELKGTLWSFLVTQKWRKAEQRAGIRISNQI